MKLCCLQQMGQTISETSRRMICLHGKAPTSPNLRTNSCSKVVEQCVYRPISYPAGILQRYLRHRRIHSCEAYHDLAKRALRAPLSVQRQKLGQFKHHLDFSLAFFLLRKPGVG